MPSSDDQTDYLDDRHSASGQIPLSVVIQDEGAM